MNLTLAFSLQLISRREKSLRSSVARSEVVPKLITLVISSSPAPYKKTEENETHMDEISLCTKKSWWEKKKIKSVFFLRQNMSGREVTSYRHHRGHMLA